MSVSNLQDFSWRDLCIAWPTLLLKVLLWSRLSLSHTYIDCGRVQTLHSCEAISLIWWNFWGTQIVLLTSDDYWFVWMDFVSGFWLFNLLNLSIYLGFCVCLLCLLAFIARSMPIQFPFFFLVLSGYKKKKHDPCFLLTQYDSMYVLYNHFLHLFLNSHFWNSGTFCWYLTWFVLFLLFCFPNPLFGWWEIGGK